MLYVAAAVVVVVFRADGQRCCQTLFLCARKHAFLGILSNDSNGHDVVTVNVAALTQVRDLALQLNRCSLGQRLFGGLGPGCFRSMDFSFEVHGGEIVAIFATSNQEGSTLLDILANRFSKWSIRLHGDNTEPSCHRQGCGTVSPTLLTTGTCGPT
nr:uncharacterized protein LOC129386872 [Dermacentor andersoni]